MTAPLPRREFKNVQRSHRLDIQVWEGLEAQVLRVARHVLAQYLKVLNEAMEEDQDEYLFPWGVMDYCEVLEDQGGASSILASITPAEDEHDHFTGIETPYREHMRRILAESRLKRDVEDEEDEDRHLQRIYQEQGKDITEEQARRYLLGEDEWAQKFIDECRPASQKEAFATLMSVERLSRYTRPSLHHALVLWQLPRGVVPDNMPEGQDDRRNRIDRRTSVAKACYAEIFDIL